MEAEKQQGPGVPLPPDAIERRLGSPGVLAGIRRRLEAAFGARLKDVILYGSTVRGDDEPDSDIDLLVLVSEPYDWGRDWDLAYDALYDIYLIGGRPLSIKVKTLAQYETSPMPFYRNVHREGLHL